MRIQDFLKDAKIPNFYMWYFLLDGYGRKTPIGAMNNADMTYITNQNKEQEKRERMGFLHSKPTYYKDRSKTIIYLKGDERDTLKECFSVFINYINDGNHKLSVIDVDELGIKTLDEFIAKTGYDFLKDCPWCEGNTKGIHIYCFMENIPNYSDHIDVYTKFKGDFFHNKNIVWERVEKEIHNYNGSFPKFNYFDIQHIFNEKIQPQEESEEEVEEKQAEEKPKQFKSSNGEVERYVRAGIKYNIFSKYKDAYTIWRNIGFLIKGEMGDEGLDLWLEVCEVFEPEKYDKEEATNFYKGLNRTIKNDNKKPLTIKSLVKYYKDADPTIAKQIFAECFEKTETNLKANKLKPKLDPNFDGKFDETKINQFDGKYMNELTSYTAQKLYFELFCRKVLRPSVQYIFTEENKDMGKDLCYYTESDIIKAFKHIKTQTEMEGLKQGFTHFWLEDECIACYNTIDFIPENKSVIEQKNDYCYNLFQGYSPLIHTKFEKTDPKQFYDYETDKGVIKMNKLLKPFMDLGLELCGGNKNHFQYHLYWIADIIQYPNRKNAIAMIFKGKQGTGKNVYLNAIGQILGRKHYISSSNPRDFFGDYAEGFYHKLLVNMNECEGKDTFDFEGKIKSFISEDRITINPKCVRPFEIMNLARMIIFTNKPRPVPIDVRSGDRRFVVYQTNDTYLDGKYGTTFWTKLVAHFKRPDFIACLYDYFNNLDISQVNWKNDRPITEAYKEMCKLYVPVEALFFDEYLAKYRLPIVDEETGSSKECWNNEISDIKAIDLYKDYITFLQKTGYINDRSYSTRIQNFNAKLTELEIPHCHKKKSVDYIYFTPSVVYNFLVKKKWILKDEDEPEMEEVINKGEDFEEYFKM